MAPQYTVLRGNINLAESQISDLLEHSVLGFFQWGCLGASGFFNVAIPTSGAYGSYHILRPAKDRNYSDGQVWQAFRKDWIWESGIQAEVQPIQISGVYINGAFQPATGIAYSHTVNYPLGQIIFNDPISTGLTVTAEYSFRWHQWSNADAEWWQELQQNSFRMEQFSVFASGQWAVPAQNRIQLPAVVVEAIPQTTRKPHALGTLDCDVKQDVLFHILTENRWDRKQLHDLITTQWQKRILGFDRNALERAGKTPLFYDGSRNPSGLQYPDIIEQFYWKQIIFQEMASVDYGKLGGVHYAVVRVGCEIYLP